MNKNSILKYSLAALVCLSAVESRPAANKVDAKSFVVLATAGTLVISVIDAMEHAMNVNYNARLAADIARLESMQCSGDNTAFVKLASASWRQWWYGENTVKFDQCKEHLHALYAEFAERHYRVKHYSHLHALLLSAFTSAMATGCACWAATK